MRLGKQDVVFLGLGYEYPCLFNSVVEYKPKTLPEIPLTESQKKELEERCLDYCQRAYVRMIKINKVQMPGETLEDLFQGAFLKMSSALTCFDLAKCGPIGDEDEPGEGSPKTLDWYFKNFYSQHINWERVSRISRTKQKIKSSIKGSKKPKIDLDADDFVHSPEFFLLSREQKYGASRLSALFKMIANKLPEDLYFYYLRFYCGVGYTRINKLSQEKLDKLNERLIETFRKELKQMMKTKEFEHLELFEEDLD